MKLDTLPLRKFSRFYSAIVDIKDPRGSCVDIDLKSGLLRFATTTFAGQMTISSPAPEGEDVGDDFMIPGEKFFSIINEYPEISFEDGVIITSDGRFDLGVLREKNDWPVFKRVLASSVVLSFSGDRAIGQLMMEAAPFASRDLASPVSGVFIKKGHIIGTDRVLVYDNYVDSAKNEQDVGIPLALWSAIATLPYPEIKLSWDEGLLRLEAIDGTFRVNFASKEAVLEAPDMTDPDFCAAFNHDTTVEVATSSLLDALHFFDNFTKSAPHNRIKLSASSTKELVLEVVDGVAASRRLPAVIHQDLVGDRYAWFSSKNLVKAIEALGKTESIIISLDYDGVAADIHDAGPHDRHVIVTLLEE
jgi:hypothetical protein